MLGTITRSKFPPFGRRTHCLSFGTYTTRIRPTPFSPLSLTRSRPRPPVSPLRRRGRGRRDDGLPRSGPDESSYVPASQPSSRGRPLERAQTPTATLHCTARHNQRDCAREITYCDGRERANRNWEGGKNGGSSLAEWELVQMSTQTAAVNRGGGTCLLSKRESGS